MLPVKWPGSIEMLTACRPLAISGLLSRCGTTLGLLTRDLSAACGAQRCHVSTSGALQTTEQGDGRRYAPHYLFSMPSLSPLMTEGRIVEWKVGEGDQVEAFDLVCDIETESLTEREDEKFILEVESQEDAYLARILISAGQVCTAWLLFAGPPEHVTEAR